MQAASPSCVGGTIGVSVLGVPIYSAFDAGGRDAAAHEVQDECDGTLTKVRRGVVSVRDIKRKKTVKVKAGHSYLASAVTPKSRRKKK